MIPMLDRAAAAAQQVLEGVKADQLGESTPCTEWNVAGLIDHMVNGQHWFATFASGGALPEGEAPSPSKGDFVAAYADGRKAAVEAFSAEGVLQKTLSLPFGEMPGIGFLGMAITDTFTHAWDLAKATGQSTDIDPELAAQILAQAKQTINPAFRNESGNPFGLEQEAPEGSTAADQLAAFLGRKV